MSIFHKSFSLVLVLIFSIPAILPFFHPGFFPIHDDTQVARVDQMAKALQDGMFPVRWTQDLGYGYGYPIFTFYAPLAYYMGAAIVLFGFNALIATKIMMVVGILLSGVAMYLFAKEFWGRDGGIIAGILYVFAPYHAVNIFVRGAVSEYIAYSVIPFVFWALWKTYTSQKFRYVVIGSVAYASIIASHNLTAMMVSPIYLVFALALLIQAIKRGNRYKQVNLILLLLLGIMLSGFYWLPAMLQLSYTNVFSQVGGGADFREHFVCLPQFWESQWGFGGSATSCSDGLSFRIGKLHLIFMGISVPLALLFFKRREKSVWAFMMSVFFLSVLLATSITETIWQVFSPMAFFQYPWRFLSLIAFSSSFLGGSWIWYLSRRFAKQAMFVRLGSFCILVITVMFYSRLFEPQVLLLQNANDYTNKRAIQFEASKISDEYLPKGFKKPSDSDQIPNEKFLVSSGDATVISSIEKTHWYEAKIDAKTPTMILTRLAYYPAWNLYINGQAKDYEVLDNGLTFPVPIGKSTIVLSYKSTSIERAGNILSVIGFAALVAGIIMARKEAKL